MYFECKLEQYSWFMQFQLNVQENNKKNTFREKETTNKVAVVFFNDKLLTEK